MEVEQAARMKITRFEEIEAWRKSRALAKRIYGIGLGSDWDLQRQMRKAAVSVMANIAERFDGGSDAEFRRFLRISKRSATELLSHLYVALDQGYIRPRDFKELYEAAAEIQRLIGGFIRYLRGNVQSS